MEISQYSIAGHRCHFTNKVERGGNAYMNRAYTQTPPFPVVVFPDLRVCVCVCARLLLSLHHDFEYAWLDVLPRRCCSKNSTVIFSISAEARFFFFFFSIDSSSRWCTTRISTDERKEKSCNIDRIHVLRDEIPPAWRNFEFYVQIHPLVEQRADGSSETV